MKKIFIIILSILFIINGCDRKRASNSEFGVYEFEKYISKLISNRDALEVDFSPFSFKFQDFLVQLKK